MSATAACHLAKTILSVRGEGDAIGLAVALIAAVDSLDDLDLVEFIRVLATDFGPDPAEVGVAAHAYLASPDPDTLLHLQQAIDPPRQELFRRMNRAPGGTAAIVRLRARLLACRREATGFRGLDADLRHLLASWFNPGFLSLERIDWSSPAAVLEKLIEHEAVHEITGWDDLRRRLRPDRRCFAFFHPQLPSEPLIFVEVALVTAIVTAIAPLLDTSAPVLEPARYRTAMFYSISNCQPGLRGISIGAFLIKRVAELLEREIPALDCFCTISPMPGFSSWLEAIEESSPGTAEVRWAELIRTGWHPAAATDGQRNRLLELAARYLVQESATPRGDPVARFHLSNGASVHGINWAADLAVKGIRQSCGIMVNYLYDLATLERNHQAFINGIVMRSGPAAAAPSSSGISRSHSDS